MISVVMSVHNGASTLARAIESILDQTYKDLEFIIINNGSTDGTIDILNDYWNRDKRIQLIWNQKPLTLSEALNQGIESAKGRYIARMDADDIAFSHRLENQVSFLESHPEVGVCGSWYLEPNRNQNPVSDSEIRVAMPWYNPIAHPTVTMRREILYNYKDNNWYNKLYHVAQDYELWTNLVRITRFYNLPEFLLVRSFKPDYQKLNLQIREEISIKLMMHKRGQGSLPALLKSCITSILPPRLRERIRTWRQSRSSFPLTIGPTS